ncbi:uncharacterized protein SPPG_02300 [Spizellomyces punctatus DAOM BR117]|uniref:Serine/threonine-protein kinase 19 n=1 Tax=Spizellomyces punctatus (strain DAOM BR117) TaxID=645134 RepID=A0A0L0HQ63_SPIPD|nr:uncharacterized protein SPPG_02300 [Spizellomyces punctatus DAOM BR117]KND03247.1 hypothetical protein SPPG_02300 [Spizellomyces punctatus DAOM BR117]|eukprot:XP_016611286.1 hypothetical protein SPPG_02300 [Spizellomyces punctatus DAOM BR117]
MIPKSKGKRSRPIPTWTSQDNPAIAELLAAYSFPPKQKLSLSPSLLRSRTFPSSPASSSPLVQADIAVQPSTPIRSNKSVLQACVAIRDLLPTTVPPLVLVDQLYAQLGNANVDRELARLCRLGAVRKFKVGAIGEFCIMLSCDYADQIREVATMQHGGITATEDTDSRSRKRRPVGETEPEGDNAPPTERHESESNLYERYIQYVTKGHYETVHVSKADLQRELVASDDEISTLFSAGFLTLKDVDDYWISVRNAGLYWTNFIKGRQELLQAFKRRRYNEILEKEIEERPLRSCVLPPKVILLELLGKGLVESFDTPTGRMIRLRKKADARDVKW